MKKYQIVTKEVDKKEKRKKQLVKIFTVILGLSMVIPMIVQIISPFINTK